MGGAASVDAAFMTEEECKAAAGATFDAEMWASLEKGRLAIPPFCASPEPHAMHPKLTTRTCTCAHGQTTKVE